MTTADLWLKVKVKGNWVVIVDRTGQPIMRAIDVTPLKAIRKMLAFVNARLQETPE